jgi:poly(A) polymerase
MNWSIFKRFLPGKGVTDFAPVIIPRSAHPISHELISANALKVLHRLKEAGYASLLVGGCVRDLMLGREPKDFDVVTDARPEQIRAVFRNSRLIGRRFRLAHVHFGREIIEVATFRASPQAGAMDFDEPADAESAEMDTNVREDSDARDGVSGRLLRDNVFGTQEEDAVRRDFTVNGLYYNFRDDSVMDYVGGVKDLRQGILRVIGDPVVRYREDPVRMLRVVRFAAKLGFRIERATAAPIHDMGMLLLEVPPARMFEEVLKLFHSGYAVATFELLRQYGLFKYLFPLTEDSLGREQHGFPLTLLPKALASTDARVTEDKPVNPAFLFAALLWEPLRFAARERIAKGQPEYQSWQSAAEDVLRSQLRHVTIPKRLSFPMREIWLLQSKFARRYGKQAWRLLEHKRFRAAYDFLLLRIQVGEENAALGDWWTRFQAVQPEERQAMIDALASEERPAHAPRRRRRRRSHSGDHAPQA